MKAKLYFVTCTGPLVITGEVKILSQESIRMTSDYTGSAVMYDFADPELKKVELILR